MKKKMIMIGVCLAILLAVFIKNIISSVQQGTEPDGYQKELENTEYMTRAEVAKLLCLLLENRSTIEVMEGTISYKDVKEDSWYYKYINGMEQLGMKLEQETESKFRPFEGVTYEEWDCALEGLLNYESNSSEKSSTKSQLIQMIMMENEQKKSEHVMEKLVWLDQYERLVKMWIEQQPKEENQNVKTESLKKEVLYVLSAGGEENTKDEWSMKTQFGNRIYEGHYVESNVDQQLSVYTRGEDILWITGRNDQVVILENVWIIHGEQKEIQVFVNGFERTFYAEHDLTTKLDSVIGNVEITKQKVTKVSQKPDRIQGKVLSATKEYIELEEYGKLELDSNYCIYKIYGKLSMEKTNGILVGYTNTDFVVANGKICAALIKEEIKAKDIRVMIKTDGFAGNLHNSVTFTADCPFTLVGKEEQKEYKASEKVTITPDSKWFNKGRIRVVTSQEDGKITVLSVKRSSGNPSYRGAIEMAKQEQGLILINELPVEEYLYAVIPSEMPTSYGLEALKVQAICARTYALKQLLENRYQEYGAHVDDSVSSQVYNNIPENDMSILAVKETYGKVMQQNGQVITAYYYSTSCGFTANAQEVWPSEQNPTYLTGTVQTVSAKDAKNFSYDLSTEKGMRSFLTSYKAETYDSPYAWYRWKVTIPVENMKKSIDSQLSKRYQVNPSYIQTLVNGNYVSISIDTVGTVKDIKVTGRGKCGIVNEIVITGSKNTVKVLTEYNIRAILAPLNDTITRQDESTVDSLSMLPSAFFVLDKKLSLDTLSSVTFIGGGYGHGVGMSQNGVKSMVDQGYECEDILKHYYKGVELGFLYAEE